MEISANRGALELLESARHGSTEAALALRPPQRYAAAHLAALRAAAAVLAARARPARSRGRSASTRRGPRSAWTLLAEVCPELAEWAAVFAAGAGKRAAAEAGLNIVTAREADDLLRDVEAFIAVVETLLGVPYQTGLALTGESQRPVTRRAG